MTEVVRTCIEYYNRAIEHADPRVKNWFLLWANPLYVIGLTALYLFVVLYGPVYMKNRKPIITPTWILLTYNLGLVALSLYMFWEIAVGSYLAGYSITCARMNVSTDPVEMRVTNALWWYFFSKAIEFMDTVFMVLRKHNHQITFLHVFHHASMLNIWWAVMTWIPGGQSFFGSGLNSLVHVVMYLYYGLSTVPSLREKLWWKKYITKFQLLQFVFTLTHTAQGIIRGCEFPAWGQWLLFSYMIVMLILFSQFYMQAYSKAQAEKKLHHGSNGVAKPKNNAVKHD